MNSFVFQLVKRLRLLEREMKFEGPKEYMKRKYLFFDRVKHEDAQYGLRHHCQRPFLRREHIMEPETGARGIQTCEIRIAVMCMLEGKGTYSKCSILAYLMT